MAVIGSIFLGHNRVMAFHFNVLNMAIVLK
jgi:hypothetical protein